MAGSQHQIAADQFNELERSASTLISQIHAAAIEEITFPEGEEPVFPKKRGLAIVPVSYDTKKKAYTTQYQHNELRPGDAIEVDCGDFALHYCWSSAKSEYVRIKDPPREHSAKYYTTCQGFHILRERQIKVDSLLGFATRTTSSLREKLLSTVKTRSNEEQVLDKFSHYKCYIQLIKTIVEKVKKTHGKEISQSAITSHKEDINALVDAMRSANVQPKCKPLANPVSAVDFATTHDDTTLMALAEVLITSPIAQTDIPTEPTDHLDNPRRYRTKRKEHWSSKIAEIQAECCLISRVLRRL